MDSKTTSWDKKFKLPCQENVPEIADKVCVVSVVGKGRHGYHKSKASILNNITPRDVFFGKGGPDGTDLTSDHAVEIEGYYDEDNKVVFLHLWSAHDTTVVADMCQRAHEEITQMGYSNFLQSTESQYAKALLYLFSISHVILLVHQGSSFDLMYVRLFRILDSIRLKVQPSVSEALRGLGLPKDWVAGGRPCSPRVLFLFERCNLVSLDGSENTNKTRSQKTPPIQRLQHAIEDQIYRILRKARIITNISNNSLFAVPANQEFVYVSQDRDVLPDPVSYYLDELQRNCASAWGQEIPRSRGYQVNRRRNQPSAAYPSEARGVYPQQSQGDSPQNSFREFLQQHIDLALSKGFDDNIGRNPVLATFDLPQLKTWFEVSKKLHGLLLEDQNADSRVKPYLNTLKSSLEVDGRFSELRCAKILPMAERAYREGLPVHYTRQYHDSKLEQAEQVFQQQARGPAAEKYLKQLAESCLKVWQKGRQQCEERSLTNQPCLHPIHRLPGMPQIDSNADLPSMAHCSQIVTKSACNCGNKLSEREDPFDHRTANFDFYQTLEPKCCGDYEKYLLPVFQSSKADLAKAIVTMETLGLDILRSEEVSRPLVALKASDESTDKDPMSATDPILKMSGLSLDGSSDLHEPDISTGDSIGLDPEGTPDLAPTQDDDIRTGEDDDAETTLIMSPARQASTTEYLPGMLHSESAAGLLPKFPSWSLICLGKYSSYYPGHGLDQPSFMHGSNFLLPWDFHLKSLDRDKWPTIGESPGARRKPQYHQHQRKMLKENDNSLRIYIGTEYECPRGHRFTLSSPEKLFKAPASGIFKETAGRILHNDMPLYFPCHCRSSKGFIGQLMRIFVAVPEGPVEVKLNVRVRPYPSPCPVYYPSSDGPIPLTSGLWVLRLPYVYLGESGPYLMPTDSRGLASCRVFKGILSMQETS